MNKRNRFNTPTRFTLAEIEAQCRQGIAKATQTKPVLLPAPIRPDR